jgi:Y_Y_Y domain
MAVKRISIILVLTIVALIARGQTGNYFVTNLTPPDEKIDPRSVGMAQDVQGVIYFTNKNGILEFDGNNWRLVTTPGSVYTIASSGNQIFGGGTFGFGRLEGGQGKAHEFSLISGKPNIFSSLVMGDKIFFCNESEIFSFSIGASEMDKTTVAAGDGNFFGGLFSIGGKLLVNTTRFGLQEVQGGSLKAQKLGIPDSQILVFSTQTNATESILGTEDGRIYKTNASNMLTEIKLVDADLAANQVVLTGASVGRDLLALGTLKGGVIFVDPNTGVTKEIIDYNLGLPDNEVMALFSDKNKGVWVAHEYGFSRIAPFLPFRSFNRYPGLSGNLICVKEINGRLFAGTSLGLYYLKTEDKYDEIEIVEPTMAVQQSAETKAATPVPAKAVEQAKTRKRLFGFLRSKKNAADKEKVNDPLTTDGQTQIEDLPAPLPKVKRTKKVLKSRQYIYQKVEGIDGKVNQLIDANGKTIVSGLGGAFTLGGLTARPIFKEPVRFAFYSTTLNQLLLSTYDDKTISLDAVGDKWRETHYLDTLRDYISYMFEDELDNIWFCGKTQVYKMELVDAAITLFVALPIRNPMYDETVGLAMGNEVYVAASGQFNRYDKARGFVPHDSLQQPKKYFASAGDFWFSDGHQWHAINKKLSKLKLEWLGLFHNLRYLSPTMDGEGLWLVTANNELFRFSNPPQTEDSFYPLFLRNVTGDQIRLLKEKKIRLSQSESTVVFQFTKPDYTGFQATEFRYRVHGLTKDWSPWSNVNNEIKFSYLPPGDYQLAVQSRDILGKESNIELVSFEVLPHYWERWWFYALEFAFFTLLVIISIKLARSDSRYRVVSQILSLLTVILLIQFIETGISSFFEFKSSPVIQFLLQLGIALVVFPLEGQLQKFMKFASGLRV